MQDTRRGVRACQLCACCLGVAGGCSECTQAADGAFMGEAVSVTLCKSAAVVLCPAVLPGYTWDGVIHKMSDKQWGAMLDVHVSGG